MKQAIVECFYSVYFKLMNSKEKLRVIAIVIINGTTMEIRYYFGCFLCFDPVFT